MEHRSVISLPVLLTRFWRKNPAHAYVSLGCLMVKFHLSANRSLCLDACTFGHRQFPETALWITCCQLLIKSADGSASPLLILFPLRWLCHLANLLKTLQLPLNQGCDPHGARGSTQNRNKSYFVISGIQLQTRTCGNNSVILCTFSLMS